jgi:hypothetical protein
MICIVFLLRIATLIIHSLHGYNELAINGHNDNNRGVEDSNDNARVMGVTMIPIAKQTRDSNDKELKQ